MYLYLQPFIDTTISSSRFSAVRNLENNKNEIEIMKILKKRAEFFLTGMKAQEDEDDRRILLDDNTGGRKIMLRPIKFQNAGVGISTGFPCVHIYWAICIIISNLRKNRFALILPDRNYCISQGVLVVPYEHR
jgi:hypothetical protein